MTNKMGFQNKMTTTSKTEQFANYLVNTKLLNSHPYDDLKNIISYEIQKPTFLEAGAAKRNNFMGQCVNVCEREEANIYEVMGEYLMER